MLPILIAGVGGFLLLRKVLNKGPHIPNTRMMPPGPGPIHYDYPPGYTGFSVSAPSKPTGKVYHVAPGDSGARVWGRFLPSVLPNTFKALNPNVTDWAHLTGVTTLNLPANAVDKGPAAQATGVVTQG